MTVIGAGSAIITASQSGNGVYNAASDVSQTLTVNSGAPAGQLATWEFAGATGNEVTAPPTASGSQLVVTQLDPCRTDAFRLWTFLHK